jgi:cobalt/nickel transport system permease protein
LVHGISPRAKLIVAGLFVLAVVATPTWLWPMHVLEALAVLSAYAASRLPWRHLAVRFALALPFLGLVALGAPLSRGLQEGWDLMLAVLVKALLSFSAILILVSTTPFESLLRGLRQLRVPALFVAILGLTVRYLFVLLEELESMRRGRLSRTFHSRRLSDWIQLPNLIGLLFLRSLTRAENVHQAMLARGWTGDVRTLDDS